MRKAHSVNVLVVTCSRPLLLCSPLLPPRQAPDPPALARQPCSTSYRPPSRAETSFTRCSSPAPPTGMWAVSKTQGPLRFPPRPPDRRRYSFPLSASGTRTETQTGQGSDLSCTWAAEDAVAHTIDPGNCWRPVIWFLPPLSLQPSLLPSYFGAMDLGTGQVGFGTDTYRHLQGAAGSAQPENETHQ